MNAPRALVSCDHDQQEKNSPVLGVEIEPLTSVGHMVIVVADDAVDKISSPKV